MKRYMNLLTGFLLTLLCTLSLAANAADTFNYKKIVPAKALPDNPSFIVVNLYVTADDNVPVASQSYLPGEWELTQDQNAKILQVSMHDVAHLDATPNLWAETEVDGEVIGSRELVAIVAPGISVGGTIESRGDGFKFPDATIQTTAGATPADLSAHTSDAAAHHSPLVTTNEIVDGTIAPADINSSGNFTIGGLTNTGPTNINSASDIIIRDDFNGFRWYNGAGDSQLANILVNQGSSYVRFSDVINNRNMISSNSNGIGVGTTSPGSTHAVTMPSLEVTGNLEIGLTRETLVYNLTSTGSCHSHGNLTCYYGSGTVSCPVGTRVLGGGVNGSAFYGGTGDSYPSSTTAWRCESSYDLSGESDICYAICGRLE